MVVPVGLLLLCSVLTPALGCDWLSRYHHYSNITLTHLRLMGNQGTDEEMQFPEKLYKHMGQREVTSQVVFIRDSLDQIAELYRHSDLSSASWLANHTNGFRTSLDRLIAGLNTCVPTDHKHNHKQNHKLKIYYRRLRSRVLDRTAALWELMRTETKLHLERLDLMVNNIVNPRSTAAAATTRRRH